MLCECVEVFDVSACIEKQAGFYLLESLNVDNAYNWALQIW